jgi:hypothetical protein
MNRYVLSTLLAVSVPVAVAAQTPGGEAASLDAAVRKAKVTLADGLKASAAKGKPISGKYEMEEGKLQLSVYTSKADGYSEVIVDHATGKVAKSEALTKPEDLDAAKSQSATMGKAKKTLADAVAHAVKAHQGARALSATPTLKDGHVVADVVLVTPQGETTVSEPLE